MKKFALMFDDRAFFLPGIHGLLVLLKRAFDTPPKTRDGTARLYNPRRQLRRHKVDLVATSDLNKTLSYKRLTPFFLLAVNYATRMPIRAHVNRVFLLRL